MTVVVFKFWLLSSCSGGVGGGGSGDVGGTASSSSFSSSSGSGRGPLFRCPLPPVLSRPVLKKKEKQL